MAEKTSERWVTPLVITVAGFLTGFLFIYLLLSGEPEPMGPLAGTGMAAPDGPDAELPAEPENPPGPPPSSEEAAPPQPATAPPTPPTAAAPAPAAAAPGPAPASPPAPPAPPSAPPPAEAPPLAAGAPPPAATPQDPWVALLGKPCTIDFGDIRAVIVRQGDLAHGQQILWKRDIGSRARAGRIARDDKPVVVPLAFGFHPSGGRPTAAYIKVQGPRPLDGVIPLKVADTFLELRPVPGGTTGAPAAPVAP